MAEENSWWGWGSNLIKTVAETVQETGTEILQVYKEDLTELSAIVAEDSKSLIETVQTQVQQHGPIDPNNLKQLVTDGLSAVGEFAGNQIHLLKEDYVETQAWIVEKMDTFEAEETYADDKEYLEWQKTFVWTDHKDDIQQILGKNPTIMNLYQELVPGEISPSDFWSRYYYKLHLTKQEETKRTKLIQKTTAFNIVNDMGWDDGGDFLDDEEAGNNTEANNAKASETEDGGSEAQTEERVVSDEATEKLSGEKSSETPETLSSQPLPVLSNTSPVKTQPIPDDAATQEANQVDVSSTEAASIEKDSATQAVISPQAAVKEPVQPEAIKASGEPPTPEVALTEKAEEEDEDWLNWQ